MPQLKAKKTEVKGPQSEAQHNEENDVYTARLTLGEHTLAVITVRAKDDAEAKEHLERAKPAAFEGIEGTEWKVTKQEKPIEVAI